jgi:tetrapyrrole methylase family protein / MazG family protein
VRIASLTSVLSGEHPGGRYLVPLGHEWIIEALIDAGHEAVSYHEPLPEGAVLVIADSGMSRVAYICDRLLGPGGCPWDQKQTHATLKKYLLEESYELFDAIDAVSMEKMREELGDVLLQPVLHSALAKRDGNFTIDEVAHGIADKLVRRHPHVFGDEIASDADAVLRNWDVIKRKESLETPKATLDGLSTAMPALSLAQQISVRAARVGFEWPNLDGVLAKIDEELAELHEAIGQRQTEEIASELGDLLFTIVNVARWLDVDAEEALRTMVKRFKTRFERVETILGSNLSAASPDEWETAWQTAKLELSS